MEPKFKYRVSLTDGRLSPPNLFDTADEALTFARVLQNDDPEPFDIQQVRAATLSDFIEPSVIFGDLLEAMAARGIDNSWGSQLDLYAHEGFADTLKALLDDPKVMAFLPEDAELGWIVEGTVHYDVPQP